jgi:hypothetical protein
MVRAGFSGAETGHEHAEGMTLTAGGSAATIQTSVKRSGVYAYQCNSGAGNQTSYVSTPWTSSGSTFFRAYFRVSALPSSTVSLLRPITNRISARLTSGGKIQLWNDNAGTQIGSDSSATIAIDTWYRLELWNGEGGSGAVDDGALRLDGTTVASFTDLSLGDTSSLWTVGWLDAPGANTSLYLDDLAINNSTGSDQTSWPGEGKIILLVPTADSVRDALWTGGAGGTSNLYEAVNNLPPTGAASASATDASQIEHAGGAGGTTDDYEATMTTYSAAGLVSGDTVTVVQYLAVHGEDISTGAKLLSFQLLSNPSDTDSGNVTAGTSAVGAYPTNWLVRRNGAVYAPSVTLGTAPVARVRRPETASRVASVCFMGILVEYVHSEGDDTGTISSGTLAVAGQSVTGQTDTLAAVATGGHAVTGQSVTANPVALGEVAPGDLAVAGQTITADTGSVATVAAGAHAVAGQTVTGEAGSVGTIATGSHTVAGQTVTGEAGSVGTIATGAHTVAGQTVTGQVGSVGTISTGEHVASGQTVTGIDGGTGDTGTMSTGSHAVTGQTVTGTAESTAAIATGSHAVAGQAVTGEAGAVGAVAVGSLTLSGQAVSGTAGAVGTIGAGELAVSGQTVIGEETGGASETGTILAGSLAVTGQAVAGIAASVGTVATGELAVSGQDVTADPAVLAAVATGGHAVSGQAVSADPAVLGAIASGALAIDGQTIVALWDSVALIATGEYAVAGQTMTGFTGIIPSAWLADLTRVVASGPDLSRATVPLALTRTTTGLALRRATASRALTRTTTDPPILTRTPD